MTDAAWMNLAGILGGCALLITAISSLINTWFAVHNRQAITDTKMAVAAVDKKMDDGTKETQRLIGDIAKTAVAAAANRTVRATDKPRASEEGKPDVP